MTPILRIPGKPGLPLLLPIVLGVAIVLALFVGPHTVRSVGTPEPAPSSGAIAGAGGAAPLAAVAPAAPEKLTLTNVLESHSIDRADVAGTDTDLSHGEPAISAPSGSAISILGWAVDRGAGRPSSSVFATVDGRVFRSAVGVPRPDVAAALGNPAFANSGFDITIDTSKLPIGRSVLKLFGVDAAGAARYDLQRTIELDLK